MVKWKVYHYRLIEVDLSRQSQLDASPNATHHKEFIWQIRNVDGIKTDET